MLYLDGPCYHNLKGKTVEEQLAMRPFCIHTAFVFQGTARGVNLHAVVHIYVTALFRSKYRPLSIIEGYMGYSTIEPYHERYTSSQKHGVQAVISLH